MNAHIAFVTALFLLFAANGSSADLALAINGKSDCQIVLPDTTTIGKCLGQTARLIQTALKANGLTPQQPPHGRPQPVRRDRV